MLAICGNEKAFGKTYNLSGGEPIRVIDLAKLCLRLLGMERKPILHVPVWLCRMLALAMKMFMNDPPLTWQVIAGITQDANLDPSEAIVDLGYDPRKVSECLPKMFPRS